MNNAVFSVTEELVLGDGTTVITVGDGKNSRKFTVSTRLCSQYGFIKGLELSENDIEFISELAEMDEEEVTHTAESEEAADSEQAPAENE